MSVRQRTVFHIFTFAKKVELCTLDSDSEKKYSVFEIESERAERNIDVSNGNVSICVATSRRNCIDQLSRFRFERNYRFAFFQI